MSWAILLWAWPSPAQEPDTSDMPYLRSMFTIEGHDIQQGCSTTQASGKKPIPDLIPGCLLPLFHGNKGLYGSFANLPPGNSVAVGAEFKDSELNPKRRPKNGAAPPCPTPWRMEYQIDGQGSFNGSWTTGGYLTMRRSPTSESSQPCPAPAPASAQTPSPQPEATPPPPNSTKPIRILHPPIVHQGPLPKRLPDLTTETKLLLNFYAFHTSLNQVSFFGIGPNTAPADRSFFALRETIAGANADVSLPHGVQLLGELNGRWPRLASDLGQSSPSIGQIYTEQTAPGLTQQPGFLQPGEGLEYTHSGGGVGAEKFADYDLDWSVNFQQFFAPSIAAYSFRRLTIDATHDIHLLKIFRPKAGSPTSEQFATLQLRGWMAESIAPSGHVVPFYFQPTLGGGDIDNERTLPSYADYRFRAPDALLFSGQYEQPLPKYSFLGVAFRADSGKVGDSRGDIDLSHLRHSFAVGFTIRGLNFPYLTVMYAWGGREGHHAFADANLSAIAPGGGSASLW